MPPPPACRSALVVLALTAALVAGACTPSPSPSSHDDGLEPAVASRLAPRLRHLASAAPDSVVGVLIRTEAPITAEQRTALEAAGLRTGSTVGDIVTGRIRAGSAVHLARLPFVRYIEAAESLGPASTPQLPRTRPDPMDSRFEAP